MSLCMKKGNMLTNKIKLVKNKSFREIETIEEHIKKLASHPCNILVVK